jgi:hypothetical protein
MPTPAYTSNEAIRLAAEHYVTTAWRLTGEAMTRVEQQLRKDEPEAAGPSAVERLRDGGKSYQQLKRETQGAREAQEAEESDHADRRHLAILQALGMDRELHAAYQPLVDAFIAANPAFDTRKAGGGFLAKEQAKGKLAGAMNDIIDQECNRQQVPEDMRRYIRIDSGVSTPGNLG